MGIFLEPEKRQMVDGLPSVLMNPIQGFVSFGELLSCLATWVFVGETQSHHWASGGPSSPVDYPPSMEVIQEKM
jgi:hypothetical protein